MDRRHQVFVSSTYMDLKNERREIIQALLEMECLPAGMEMFPAADEDQWSLIKQVIDDSDYYLVIIGGRYGSTTPEGHSYTEMEYDYAVSQKIPAFGFIHENPGSIAADKSELDTEARRRLDAFRDKVKQKHVKFYSSAEDLGSKVSRALNIARTRNSREGWVRGRFALTPETQTEIAALRARVSDLTLQLEESKQAVGKIPDHLASGSDNYDMGVVIEWLHKNERTSYDTPKEYQSSTTVSVTWDEIVYDLGPKLIDEETEPQLRKALDKFAWRAFKESQREINPDAQRITSVRTYGESFDDVLVQLFALGIIGRGVKKRSTTDRNKYWALTPLGEDTIMKLRAIRKGDD